MGSPTVNDVVQLVSELRAEVQKKHQDLDKVQKIHDLLDAQEKANQKLVLEHQAAIKAQAEQSDRIAALEIEVARKASYGVALRDTKAYKDLDQYVKFGVMSQEQKTLRTDNDTAGGYLAHNEVDIEIVKKITEVSNLRAIARVKSVSARALEVAKRESIPEAHFEGETETGVDSESSYANETITPRRLTFTTPVTRDELMNASWNLETEMMQDASEAFAKKEGEKFVLGTGVKQPEGFTVHASVLAAARESAASGTISADDVILLTGDLKVGYNPVYTMNRQTLAFLRTLKSVDGMFLWQPGMNGPVANTINGYPYLLLQDMASIAAGAVPVAFGDFRRGYTITDRTGVEVIRDDYSQKRKGIVEFTWHRWVSGQVTLAEAIKLLKVKV